MSALFSDDYYEDGDYDDSVKPNFEDEDDANYPEDEDIEDYDDFCPEAENSKGFKEIRKKAPTTENSELVEKFVDEYYNLDYEDLIGDTPVRFGYKKVDPDSYGLDIMEILEADVKDLNAYVPLKHLAPYRKKPAKPRGKWNKRTKKVESFKKPNANNDRPKPSTSKPPKKKQRTK